VQGRWNRHCPDEATTATPALTLRPGEEPIPGAILRALGFSREFPVDTRLINVCVSLYKGPDQNVSYTTNSPRNTSTLNVNSSTNMGQYG